MRLNKCLTVEEVINGLLDQALDKRRIAGEDKDSIFMDDAIVLENAALMLDANHEEEPARLLTEADFEESNSMLDCWGHLPCFIEFNLATEWSRPHTLAGRWSYVDRCGLKAADCRFWTKMPTERQMEETPWG